MTEPLPDAQPDALPDERQRRFIQRFLDHVPHVKALGISYRNHGPDWAELEMAYAANQVAYPDTGVIASGAIFALMDSVAGLSVVMRMRELQPHATLDLRLDYLHPATPGVAVIGRSECFKFTRRVAFVRGVAHQGDLDRPVASMVGTFMLTAMP